MAVDAWLTVLGPARVERDLFGDPADYESARRRELALLEAIESELAAQLGVATRIDPPLAPHRSLEGPEVEPVEVPPPLEVGRLGEGLGPLQAAAHDAGIDAPHLVEHDPCSGLYLPIDFPRPLRIRSGSESVSVGSAIGLATELARIDPLLVDLVDRARARNLQFMVREARARGLAVELA
jgi:hypothetical protein